MPVIPRLSTGGPSQVRSVQADVGQSVSQIGGTINAIDNQLQQARRSRELNELDTDVTRRIAENESMLKSNVNEFPNWQASQKEFLTTTRDAMSSQIGDAAVRDQFNQWYNTAEVLSETRIRQAVRGLEITEGRAALDALGSTLSENYATLKSPVDRQVTIDGMEAALEAAVDDGLISEVEAGATMRAFTSQSENLRVLADVDTDPSETLAGIEAGAYDLDEKDRRVAVERAQKGIAGEQRAAATAQTKQQQETQTTIFDGIITGKMGRADIDKAYDTKDPITGLRGLTDPGKRSLVKQLRQYNKDKIKLEAAFDLYDESKTGGKALDYKIKDHREAAEAGFLRLAPEIVDLDPRGANTRIINEVLRPTLIWPKSLQSQMRVAAKSAPLNTVESFSDLYDRVSNDPTVSPVNESMVPEDQAFWSVVGSLRQAGVLTKPAIELARHNAFELTPDERNALTVRYREKKYANEGNKRSLEALVTRLDPEKIDVFWFTFGNPFSATPDVPPGMAADFENLVRMNYDFTGGDIELSRKLADEAVTRAWFVDPED